MKKKQINKIAKLTFAASLMILNQMILNGQILFEDVTEEAGLVKPLLGIAGHGAAWGDINNDGYPDLFIGTFTNLESTDYNVRGHTGGPEPDKLLLNNGDGTFEEVMDTTVRKYGWNSGAAFADFDNDGDLDLVVSHLSVKVRPGAQVFNCLFENDGRGNFKDVTERAGLNFGFPFVGRNTFVFDYDGDGLLDILMQEDWVWADHAGGDSRLMRNMGGLVFENATASAGLPHGYRTGLYGLGGFVGDINGDTWPDIFYAHTCRTFFNNKDGTFREKNYQMVEELLTKPAPDNNDWTCGADLGDLDNDGDMDIVMGNHWAWDTELDHRLYVFLNTGNDKEGNPVFQDITLDAKVADPGLKAPHVQLQDIDNDGLVDIMASNCNAFIYKNTGLSNGIPVFDKPIGSGIVGGIGYWACGPLGDYDRDGKLDFIGPDWEPEFKSPLLRNVSKNADNYLAVKLELEDHPNRNGIGARIEVYQKGKLGNPEGFIGVREIIISSGYSSGYEAIAYFGMPDNRKVDLRVIMPCNGEVFIARSVKRNQIFVIKN